MKADPPPKAEPKPADEKVAPPAAVPAQAMAMPMENNGKPSLVDTHVGPPEKLWFRGSYLYYHVGDLPIPSVLATVNGATAIGAQDVDYSWLSGGKLEIGRWLDCRHTWGLEFTGFLLQEKNRTFTLTGDGTAGSPTIGRPILDALPNVPVSIIIASPPVGQTPGFAGRMDVTTSSQLGSLEFGFARNLCYTGCWSLDALAGVRYLDLSESINIQTDTLALGGQTPFTLNASDPIYNRLLVTDRFRTRNQMWAGQFGARAEYRSGIFFGAVRGTVAMGPNQQTSDISGNTTAFQPDRIIRGGVIQGGQAGAAGGLLAVPGGNQPLANGGTANLPYGNAGTQRTDWFAIAPEVGIQAGVQVTRSLRVHLGYNFLYINNVVRPGDMIDTTINGKFVPSNQAFGSQSGPDRPTIQNGRDAFIAHGAEMGFQLLF
jgi:hypothetical protein